MQTYQKINKQDNVIVTLVHHACGDSILLETGETLMIREEIPAGHKIALVPISQGDPIIKYDSPIGTAKNDILPGQWVHTHNLLTTLGEVLDYSYEPVSSPTFAPYKGDRFFMGYQRSDGLVGVRNEIWIIPTVGCVNNVATALAQSAKNYLKHGIDDIIAFPHPYGCSQMGEDQENSRIILTDLIKHPNAAAVLVLGLGCENSGVETLKQYLGEYDENRIKFLVAQDCENEMEAGLEILRDLISYASGFERTPTDIKHLVIGMKCGGSDGFSGITANPLVGRFSDLLISAGGSTILTEVPEMFGAETLLMNRCKNETLFHQTVSLINDFKEYYKRHGQTIYENPSPGNKQGGISSLEDKSLGCTQKSGSAPVSGVLSYGERITGCGLHLLSAPGNDLVASTALAASGAQIVLFTTGRGTPFSCPVPTVKIATNTALAKKKQNWIDFNAGTLLERVSMEQLTEEFFHYVLAVASGRKVKSELAGYHDMAIFKQGVTL